MKYQLNLPIDRIDEADIDPKKNLPWPIITPQILKEEKIIRGYQDYKSSMYEDMFYQKRCITELDEEPHDISKYLVKSPI